MSIKSVELECQRCGMVEVVESGKPNGWAVYRLSVAKVKTDGSNEEPTNSDGHFCGPCADAPDTFRVEARKLQAV